MKQIIDKRFEQVDKHFEQMRDDMGRRFQQVDKRFEQMRDDMESRFQQVDKHLGIFTRAMGIGFTLTISILVVVLNFVLKI